MPPILTEDDVKNQYHKIMSQEISETEKALHLFLFISKNQIFWDGNKRTALLTANKIMFSKGVGLLSIPETKFVRFNELLSNYYNSSDIIHLYDITEFMYQNCIFGINY